MSMIQIVRAVNEVNASIIKEFLENNGIRASYAPNSGRFGRVASCTVYCEEEKSEEAVALLKEQKLIES
jgi:hypothetical protein